MKILYFFFSKFYQIIFDLIKFIKLLLSFTGDYYLFTKLFKKQALEDKWKFKLYPCLYDKEQKAGEVGEYFYQDLFVMRKIMESDHSRHIDVGSRIDGFIGNLSVAKKVEVFDIRPLDLEIENVKFTQIDINKIPDEFLSIADCVSCLHTIEHIGLGRYGDTIDTSGWKKTLNSLSKILQDKGTLWLSVPSGIQRIEFNAHRVFRPETVVKEALKNKLELRKFYFFEYSNPKIVESKDIQLDFDRITKIDYCLGIYCFEKIK